MVDLAVQRLSKHGFDVAGLHGDLNQNQREKVLDKFKDGQFKTIIATDVASRGIDVDGIVRDCIVRDGIVDACSVEMFVLYIGPLDGLVCVSK